MNDPTTDSTFLQTSAGRIEYKRLQAAQMRFAPPEHDATAIVLLHEGLGCLAMWRDFPQQLADATGYDVLIYSRPGYGRSEARSTPTSCRFMHEEALEVLPHVLDCAQLERAILLGHSDGGSIATIYAGRIADERVRALVLIAAHFFVEEVSIRSIERVAHLFATTDLRDKLARYHFDQVDSMFAIWRDAWLAPEFRSWNLLREVAGIRVPVLAIQGCDDEYCTEEQIRQFAANYNGPHLRTELIPNCRHAPHLEQPNKTLPLVSSFIEAYAN